MSLSSIPAYFCIWAIWICRHSCRVVFIIPRRPAFCNPFPASFRWVSLSSLSSWEYLASCGGPVCWAAPCSVWLLTICSSVMGPTSRPRASISPSQSVPAKIFIPPYISANFNPRARTGRDSGIPESANDMRISTHAPARGATREFAVVIAYKSFQPTRPHGARLGDSLM